MDARESTADLIAMIGGALVVFGVVVLGFLNTITDNPHIDTTNDAGEVVAEPLIPPDVRAYIVAAGLVLWLLYGAYKVITPPEPEERQRAAPADD